MSFEKFLAKRQISRQLFKVCRLNNLETRSQIKSYFREHGSFQQLKWCSPEDIKELESFINADHIRLELRWDIPRHLLTSKSIVQLAELLLEKELFPGNQMEVLKTSLRIYWGKKARSLIEIATARGTSEISLYVGRNHSVKGMIKILRSLPVHNEDLMRNYGLDFTSNLIIMDDARAQQINAKAGTDFTPQFLSLLFGIHLEEHFVLLGKPVEALAGNYLGNRHYWSGFYLLKKELAEAIDFNDLLRECFDLLHNGDGEIRSQNFRKFVSYFTKKTVLLDDLIPVAAEILYRELGLRVGTDGQLEFPPQAELLFRSYCYEALEAIGEPSIQRIIRQKMSEMHPEAFIDPKGFDSVMLEKYGFTNYEQYYFGLRKWYPDTNASLKLQDPAFLQALRQKYSRSSYRAERWQALMDFVNAHSRLPKMGVTAEEDALRKFWKGQLKRAQQGNYYPEHLGQMDELDRRFRSKKKYKPVLNWDERYAKVKAFTAARGIPPQRAATGEEKIFHNWMREQRSRMKKGKLEQRQEVLIRHFDELFPYKNKKYYELYWDEKYQELECFVQTHSRVPKVNIRKEKSLYSWYSVQRIQMGQGELSRRQSRLIQGIIDRFPLKDMEYRKSNWHERCTELEQFAEAHSHLPRFTVKEENPLHTWFSNQKLLGTKGKLDTQQLARLQKLSDNFQVPSHNEQHFYERFEELKDFVAAHSRLPKHAAPEELSLYCWSWMQLKRADAGKLNPKQREELKKLCDPYRKVKPDWTERFRQVRAFAETHSRLPKKGAATQEEKNLGTWFLGQKARMKKGRLPKREENLISYLITRYGKGSGSLKLINPDGRGTGKSGMEGGSMD